MPEGTYPDDLDCVVPDWTSDEAAHAYMSMHKALRGEGESDD